MHLLRGIAVVTFLFSFYLNKNYLFHYRFTYIIWSYYLPCSCWKARYKRLSLKKKLSKHERSRPSLFLPCVTIFVLSLLGLAATLHVYFRTATKVSEMLGNVNTSSALSAFEKMEEKGKFSNCCRFINSTILNHIVYW